MTRDVPDEVLDAVTARSAARAIRDWETADRLKAIIEAAGWRVIDRGTRSRVERAQPPDVIVEAGTRYGSSASVPSLLDAPSSGAATIALVRAVDGVDRASLVAALADGAPPGASLVVVADGPDAADDPWLDAVSWAPGSVEVLRTSARLGLAPCLAIAVRRATGSVIVLADGSAIAAPGATPRLIAALEDPSIAIVGAAGIGSAGLPRLHAAGPGDVTAVGLALAAFRRSDATQALPVDERYRSAIHLAAWWSLALRDSGPGRSARRAVVLSDLLVGDRLVTDERARDRAARRDGYRILERFGDRPDLLVAGSDPGGA